MEGAGRGTGMHGGAQQPPPPFLSKTYDMVEDPATDTVVSWGRHDNSFVVWNPPEFARDLLPKYFKHSNFSSFVRQLNTYGFRKVDPDQWEFANEGFLRGQKHLLKSISRRKPLSGHSQQPPQAQSQNTSVGACVEVGKFGLEEEIERLKRDKNVLMQELVRLRQQQQTTDNQLQTLMKRLQGMEQHQQQMMAFLAKAMQSPGFLAQIVQQNDSGRRIAGVSKKRRFPIQENEINDRSASSDGQIIKYQPLLNEAAKAMLVQILKMDTSSRLEHANGSDNFLLGNSLSQTGALGTGGSTRNSGVLLAEMPSNTGISFLPSNSGCPEASSAGAVSVSEIHPSTGMADMEATAAPMSPTIPADVSALSPVPQHSSQSERGMVAQLAPDLHNIQCTMPQGNINAAPNSSFAVPATSNGFVEPQLADAEGIALLDIDNLSPMRDISLLEGDSILPGISDSFWEQFLATSPVSGGETEDVNSGTHDDTGEMQTEQEDDDWGQSQNMEHLTGAAFLKD